MAYGRMLTTMIMDLWVWTDFPLSRYMILISGIGPFCYFPLEFCESTGSD
jgi:hypothetical protein